METKLKMAQQVFVIFFFPFSPIFFPTVKCGKIFRRFAFGMMTER